jgi:thiol-disulfide isomerase/thioredoxin
MNPLKSCLSLLLIVMHLITTAQNQQINIVIKGQAVDKVFLGKTIGTKALPEIEATSLGMGKYEIVLPNYNQKGVRSIIFRKEPNAGYSQIPVWIDGSGTPITMTCTSPNLYETVRFEGSAESNLYFEYFRTNSAKNETYKNIRERWATSSKVNVGDSMMVAERDWRDFQQKFIADHPQSIITPFIEMTALKIPDFKDLETRAAFYRNQFLGQYKVGDTKFWETPLSIDLVNHYCYYSTGEDYTDVQSHAMQVLKAIESNTSVYQYYLNYMLNSYSKMSVNDYDRVFMEIVNQYVVTGKAKSVEHYTRTKHIEATEKLAKLMTGQILPDEVFKSLATGEDKKISETKGKYKLILFWSPDCSHCKKEIPLVIQLLEQYKNKSVDVITVCNNKTGDNTYCNTATKNLDIPQNWEQWGLGHNPGQIVNVYDLTSFPKFFIVDSTNKIVFRRKGAASMEEIKRVLDRANL